MEAPASAAAKPEGPRFESLQVFRGAAALWVLWFHVGLVAAWAFQSTFANNFFRSGHLGVTFFFVLSGFIIAYVHRKDIGRPETSQRYLLKRAWRIYPLSILVTAAYLPLHLRFGDTPTSLSQILCSFLLLPQNGYPVITVMWTLTHEVFFYGIFLFVIILGLRAGAILLGGWGLATCILQRPGAAALDPLPGFVFGSYNLQFLIGVVVAYLFVKRRLSVRASYGGLAVSLVLLVGGCVLYDQVESLSVLAKRLYWASCFGLLILSTVSLENSLRFRFPRFVMLLGDASFSIYLVHLNILGTVAILCNKFSVRSHVDTQVLLMVMGLLALIGGLAAWRCLEKPLLDVAGKFNTRRRVYAPEHS